MGRKQRKAEDLVYAIDTEIEVEQAHGVSSAGHCCLHIHSHHQLL